MKKYSLSLVFIIALTTPSLLSAQGATCAEMEAFCSDFGASFPASIDTQADPANQYGCLGTQPNPAWYYLEIGSGVDCSYDPQAVEIADIPNAQTGEVYVFLITNFSGLPTEIFLNQTAGESSTDCSVVGCTNSGGQVIEPTTIELCADDPPYTLETMNEMTDPASGLPDILWAVWVLNDPLGVTLVPGGGPLPNDSFMPDDLNYIGVLNNGPGQLVFGTNIPITPDGSGVTYYIAPLVGDGSFGTFDSECTGLDPAQGYTIYMNPPLNADVTVNSCNIQVDLTGGFPSIDNTADYTWSYTTPNGQTVTGTGTPVNVVGDTDGDYTFSITNDGSDCDLLGFATVTLVGCDCSTSTAEMPCDDGDACTINDVETVSDVSGAVCVPCAGMPIDCGSGQTTVQICDDGNPNTENDMETVLNCDGSICIPCEGTLIVNTSAVPTLSEWGLIILALLMAIAAVAGIRVRIVEEAIA